jgi:opacity protein-like surface antigen
MTCGRLFIHSLLAVLLAAAGLVAPSRAAESTWNTASIRNSTSTGNALAKPSLEAASDADEAAAGEPPPRRLYVSGMVASSVHGRAAESAGGAPGNPLGLSGQGAMGVAIPRPAGALRLELEGRVTSLPAPAAANRAAADPLAVADAAGTASASASPTDDSAGWVTTVNAWRDVALPAHVGLYAGGGIGMASVTDAAAAGGRTASGLAWQAGGGITYAATDRLTIDIGYRVSGADPAGLGRGSAGEPTGEALVAIRLFEPFGGWSNR